MLGARTPEAPLLYSVYANIPSSVAKIIIHLARWLALSRHQQSSSFCLCGVTLGGSESGLMPREGTLILVLRNGCQLPGVLRYRDWWRGSSKHGCWALRARALEERRAWGQRETSCLSALALETVKNNSLGNLL